MEKINWVSVFFMPTTRKEMVAEGGGGVEWHKWGVKNKIDWLFETFHFIK
jgi:hypothetical protein